MEAVHTEHLGQVQRVPAIEAVGLPEEHTCGEEELDGVALPRARVLDDLHPRLPCTPQHPLRSSAQQPAVRLVPTPPFPATTHACMFLQ